MPELEFIHYVLLVAAGFAGGFVDSIAGGGGIITVPVFLLLGLPPHMALGTNKLQASFGSVTAAIRYVRSGLADKGKLPLCILSTAIGAALGTSIVQLVAADFLMHVVVIMLFVILVYSWFNKGLGKESGEAQVSYVLFSGAAGITLGFYDGFFGPGTGSFWTLAFVLLQGYNLKKATAHTKVMNATSNLLSLGFFLLHGQVFFMIGFMMGCAQVVGAWAGSHLVIRNGVGFIRKFFLTVVLLTLIKLVWDNYL